MRSILYSMVTASFVLTLGCGGGQGAGSGATGPVEPAGAGAAAPIPAGFFAVTPALTVADVDAAMDFYTRAFAAKSNFKLPGPDGKTVHAEIKVGDSIVMLGAEMPQMGVKSPITLGGSPASLTYYTADVDGVFAAAIAAGAKAIQPPQDMFWGARYAMLTDPFGHRWDIAMQKEDLTPEQMKARAAVAFGGGDGAPPTPGTPAASPVPPRFHTLTPGIIVADAAQTIEFYKRALGAEEVSRFPAPNGSILYAEVKIGDSIVIVADENPEMGAKSPKSLGGSPFGLMIYVPDADAAYAKAIAAGARVGQPLEDAFWGDRYGEVQDSSGHRWGIATHKEDLSPEQIQERMKAAMGGGQAHEGAEPGHAP